jgi:hypothetical protein
VKELAAIVAAYSRVDGSLEQERVAAVLDDDLARARQLVDIQRINDQAYFVLCWGQLEIEVNARCRATIRHRKNSRQRHIRRAWDLYSPDDPRLSGLSFENRAALVLDRQAGRGSPWARLLSHYGTRNQIAHGALQAQGIDIPAIAADFYTIQSALEQP